MLTSCKNRLSVPDKHFYTDNDSKSLKSLLSHTASRCEHNCALHSGGSVGVFHLLEVELQLPQDLLQLVDFTCEQGRRDLAAGGKEGEKRREEKRKEQKGKERDKLIW